MKRFRWQLRALAVLAVVGFTGFAYNRVIATLTDENRRVMPPLSGLGDYLAVATLGTTLYMLYVLVRHVRIAIRERSTAAKIGIWTGSLLAHAVLAIAAAGLILAMHPDFPFGPRLLDTATSPDGQREAYLYEAGLLCGYDVYVRRSGNAELRKLRDIPRHRCEQRVHLRWRDDASDVDVVGDDGQPLAPQTWQLYLGPH